MSIRCSDFVVLFAQSLRAVTNTIILTVYAAEAEFLPLDSIIKCLIVCDDDDG